jgi:PAS domain S-box-containing protein
MLAELSDVTRALDRDEVIPYFQPIVELRTGRLTGFEMLARWQHPEHGPILPTNFIPLAEENGLIEELTRQVFRKAFQSAPLLAAPLTLSVNISPLQLYSSNLVMEIRKLAEEGGFPLDRLMVEITESALLSNLAEVKRVAGKLKAMGCKLALDDFGTGYSSLLHLQALPFDELKVDRSFVHEMTKKRESRKIVAAIIGLGQSLGLTTVAEGVETEEQAHMLLWLGCEQGQGWRYGRPEPAASIPGVIAQPPMAVLAALVVPGEEWASSNLEALPTLRLAQLQAIYDGAPVGLCFLDCKLRYVSLNRKLAEMNEYSVDAHVGRAVSEMFPEWYPVYEPYYIRALQGEAITGVKLIRPPVKAGQREGVFLASYQPAWDESDEVIGISVALLDITENRWAEGSAKMTANADLQESLPDINPEVPWVMDAEGNDLQVSARWVRTTPLGKDKTRNLRWLEALHADDLERIVQSMGDSLRTGQPINIEYRVVGPDGGWRWMRSRGSPRYGSFGEITRWYGSVEDIQEQKQADESMRDSWERSIGEQNIILEGMRIAKELRDSTAKAPLEGPDL